MNKLKIFLIGFLSILLISCQEDKKLIIGTSADNPPYEYMRKGDLVGFDIDLIHEISRNINRKIKVKNFDFHALIPALENNEVDMVIAGMSVTEERKKRVHFSTPYTTNKVAILFRKNDGFNSPADFKDKIVGSQVGTTWSLLAYDLAVTHKFHTKSLPSNLELVEDLNDKQVDAVVMEAFQAKSFIDQNPELSSFVLNEYDTSFAIAMPKDSPYKEEINNSIAALQKRIIPYLHNKWKLPGDGSW